MNFGVLILVGLVVGEVASWLKLGKQEKRIAKLEEGSKQEK